MANKILKGLAVAAGSGLAMGFSSARIRVRNAPRNAASDSVDDPDDVLLNIEPLLDRLERLEVRFDGLRSIERQPAASDSASRQYAQAIADLERRVERHTHELALLRKSVADAEQRLNDSAVAVRRSVEQTRAELPALVEQQVTARVEDLRSRFSAEIEQAHQRTLETFERAIDEKIAARIGSMEKALAEQAGSIEALSLRTAETDGNLQKLVAAIEKLCERAQIIAPAPEQQFTRAPIQRPTQYEARLPFESQLHDAMRREPVVPVLRKEEPVVEVSAPTFIASEAPAPKKSRFLFRNFVAAGFSLILGRYLR
jgi:uncharacterized coiled-coil protein SlyX